jgi:hypothetical protein
MKEEMIGIAVIILLGCIGVALFGWAYFGLNDEVTLREGRRSILRQKGITIQNAFIKSPAVIIVVETFSEFLEKVDELGVTTVYEALTQPQERVTTYGRWFFVFNEDYTIAWAYYLGSKN